MTWSKAMSLLGVLIAGVGLFAPVNATILQPEPPIVPDIAAVLDLPPRPPRKLNNQVKSQLSGNGKHPFLLFDEKDIPALRAKATSTHSSLAKNLKDLRDYGVANKDKEQGMWAPKSYDAFASIWNTQYGDYLGPMAMYCVLYPEDAEAKALTIKMLTSLAMQPSWLKKGSIDDVTVAHSLSGFTTAADMLWNDLTPQIQTTCLAKIRTETDRLYDLVLKSDPNNLKQGRIWWAKAYIQNHVATNFLSLLYGGLFCAQHDASKENIPDLARVWLNDTIALLDKIPDASLTEGLWYASYTFNGLTNYAYLAQRHYGDNVGASSLFFSRHLEYYLYTSMPGFRKNLGIGDSGPYWAYGPESELRFVDKYSLRNGCGNWLADTLAKRRGDRNPTDSFQKRAEMAQQFHMEYLYFDPSIEKTCPYEKQGPIMHLFDDWGVATYGGGQMDPNNTFLSMKVGVAGGRTLAHLINKKQEGVVNTAQKIALDYGAEGNIRPGHEHPDQGSVTFSPLGIPVLTDNYFDKKHKLSAFSGALIFGTDLVRNKCGFLPSDKTTNPKLQPKFDKKDSEDFVSDDYVATVKAGIGQIGESALCSSNQWFHSSTTMLANSEASIIAAESLAGGGAFISGTYHHAYHPDLGLKYLQRDAILVTPELLVLVDHIQLKTKNHIKNVTASFNRMQIPRSTSPGDRYQFKEILDQDNKHHVLLVTDVTDKEGNILGTHEYTLDASSDAQQTIKASVGVAKIRTATMNHHTRISSAISPKQTSRLVTVIAPKRMQVSRLRLENFESMGAVVHFDVNKQHFQSYEIRLSSDFKAQSQARLQFLGFLGLGSIKTPEGNTIRLGVQTPQKKCVRDGSKDCSKGERIRSEVATRGITQLRLSPIVCPKKKFIYCGIPKCGVSVWRRLIRRVAGVEKWFDSNAHNPKKNGLVYWASLPRDKADFYANHKSAFSFVIVRNPYSRILSAWLDKAFLKDFPQQLSKNFTQFLVDFNGVITDSEDPHFLPMSSFCGIPTGMKFDKVARMEDIRDWGRDLVTQLGMLELAESGWDGTHKGGFFPAENAAEEKTTHNHHASEKLKEYYTPAAVEMVKKMYKADFETFGYSDTSPLL